MFEMADAAIALPGGIGTLDEMSELITLVKLGKKRCKCVFLDPDGYYRPLKEMFVSMVREEFLREEELSFVLFSGDFNEIVEFAGL